MKKLLIFAMVLTGIMLSACTSEDDEKNAPGSIYGIVTRSGSTEVISGASVSLYKEEDQVGYWTLLMTTTTFDDGHFEFLNLDPGVYKIRLGTTQNSAPITVESGRQARIDLQM